VPLGKETFSLATPYNLNPLSTSSAGIAPTEIRQHDSFAAPAPTMPGHNAVAAGLLGWFAALFVTGLSARAVVAG